MALNKQIVSIPVSGGLDQKTDSKQVMAGKALGLENVRFQKTGKISKRFGLINLPVSSNTGNINTYEVDAVVSDNEFLAIQTSNGIYGYSQGDSKWFQQSRFNRSAKIKTSFISKNQFDQMAPDCDITSDGTHIAYCVNQDRAGFSTAKNALVILEDVATGLTKSRTTASLIGGNTGIQRVICVKSGGVVYIHLFYLQGSNIVRDILDENLAVISTGTVITSAVSTSQIDLCKDASAIYFARITTTSLEIRSYNFVGVQQNTGSFTLTNGILVTAGSASGMSITTTTSNLHVSWISSGGPAIKGFTKSLVASIAELSTTGIDPRYHICICSGGSGLYMATSATPGLNPGNSNETGVISVTFTTTYTYNVVATISRMLPACQIFMVNTKPYLVLRCPEPGNNSFFLMNVLDYYICQVFSPSQGAALYQFIGNEPSNMLSKTIVVFGKAYSTFIKRTSIDTNDAGEIFATTGMSRLGLDFNYDYKDFSRQRVGPRIYLTNGAMIEVDKETPHENGFMLSPTLRTVDPIAGTANPNISGKTFEYCAIYEYYDSSGQVTRSAPCRAVPIGTGSISSIYVSSFYTAASLKFTTFEKYSRAMSIVYYRTESNGSVFYRLAEEIVSFNNGFASAGIFDTTSDSSLVNNERLYITGGVLQNDPAPPSLSSFSGGNRIFVVGLEENDEVGYSKKQLFGESVSFSNRFRIRVSTGSNADKSPLNSGAYLDGKVIIFREQSIYVISGDGPLETGAQDTFTEPESIATDVGCTDPRSVLNMPSGVMFKSRKGIYLLDRSLQVSYIGKDVEDFNDEDIVAAILSDNFNEARFYTNGGNCLVYNYLFGTWAVFVNQEATDVDIWQGSPILARLNTVSKETEGSFEDSGSPYSMRFISPWLKVSEVQGYQRCYNLWIIGDFKSPHTLKCKIYIDYDDSVSEDYDMIFDSVNGNQYQFRVSIPNQKVEAMRFEIFDDLQSGTCESFSLSNIQAEVGIKSGGYKLASTKSY